MPIQATDVSFNPDADTVIPKVTAATVNMLNAAAKEPSVKSVVLTSSSSAALIPEPNKEGIVVNEGKHLNSPRCRSEILLTCVTRYLERYGCTVSV